MKRAADNHWGKLYAGYELVQAPSAPSILKHGWFGVRYDASSALTLIGAAFRVKPTAPMAKPRC